MPLPEVTEYSDWDAVEFDAVGPFEDVVSLDPVSEAPSSVKYETASGSLKLSRILRFNTG